MKVHQLIKKLEQFDKDAFVVLNSNSYDGAYPTLQSVEQDEGIRDLDGWDVLSGWRDLKEMEEFYGASDSDPLAFMSVVVLT